MAIAVKLIVSFSDRKGKSSSTEIKIPTGLTVLEMTNFANAMLPVIDAVTNGRIESANICLGVDLSGLGLTAVAGTTADVEERGQFSFNTAGGYKTLVNIPAFSDGQVVDGSDTIDQANASVAAFITAMISGVGGVSPTDAREDDIVSLRFARERFRASGKRAS